jgi:hypothetical protein
MTPPLIVVSARGGPISRRHGRVVVEIDDRPWPIPWGTDVEIAVECGNCEVIAYLVLFNTPWPLARRLTAARARVELVGGDQRRLEYRPSHLCSGAYHGRLRHVEEEPCDSASAPTDPG